MFDKNTNFGLDLILAGDLKKAIITLGEGRWPREWNVSLGKSPISYHHAATPILQQHFTMTFFRNLGQFVFLDTQVSLALTHVCLSVRWSVGPLVTLSDFQSVSVSGRPT